MKLKFPWKTSQDRVRDRCLTDLDETCIEHTK